MSSENALSLLYGQMSLHAEFELPITFYTCDVDPLLQI